MPTCDPKESSDGSASSLETPAGASVHLLLFVFFGGSGVSSKIYPFWSSETNTYHKAEANEKMFSSWGGMVGWLDGKELGSLGFLSISNGSVDIAVIGGRSRVIQNP